MENATVAIAGFTFLVLVLQLVVFGRQARRLSETVVATEKAAKAAQDSATALPKIERAYVFVGVNRRDGKIFIDLENHGKTPAILSKVCGLPAISYTTPEEIIETFDYGVPMGIVVGSGKTFSVDITPEIRKRIRETKGKRCEWQFGKLKLFCYGRVEYQDVLKNPQWTSFCWEFDRHNKMFKISYSKLNDYV